MTKQTCFDIQCKNLVCDADHADMVREDSISFMCKAIHRDQWGLQQATPATRKDCRQEGGISLELPIDRLHPLYAVCNSAGPMDGKYVYPSSRDTGLMQLSRQ